MKFSSLYPSIFHSIEEQASKMAALLETWVSINSHSENLEGLKLMQAALIEAFTPLGGTLRELPLPPRKHIDIKGQLIEEPQANFLLFTKHPEAQIKILLGGHCDTVYPINSSFQKVKYLQNNIMNGPGVSDMKGGLVILLNGLQAFEQSPLAGKIGWEILISPNEEQGSSGAESIWVEAAKRNSFGLLFEPSFPDGSIVGARKGSINFTLVARGKAAHAGREMHLGRNAITALAHFIIKIEKFNNHDAGLTINIGQIEGGGPINIVPELAICRFNVRAVNFQQLSDMREAISQLITDIQKSEGIHFELYEQSYRSPKAFDSATEDLYKIIEKCGIDLGYQIKTKPSGGVCDGNILAEAGLSTIDTLGAIGGDIHTHDEYIFLDSLTERSKLLAAILCRLATAADFEGIFAKKVSQNDSESLT